MVSLYHVELYYSVLQMSSRSAGIYTARLSRNHIYQEILPYGYTMCNVIIWDFSIVRPQMYDLLIQKGQLTTQETLNSDMVLHENGYWSFSAILNRVESKMHPKSNTHSE